MSYSGNVDLLHALHTTVFLGSLNTCSDFATAEVCGKLSSEKSCVKIGTAPFSRVKLFIKCIIRRHCSF